jgi:integrase
MAKRRKKRTYEVSKRCHCPDQATCSHHWFLRVYTNGERQRIDLTERFPGETVEVAAARAKDLARKGLLDVKPTDDARLTMGDVADRYVAARDGHKHHYLDGLRLIEVPASNGTMVKIESKPIDEVTTRDIKEHAVATWKKRPRCGPIAIRQLLQAGRHFFRWAVEEGYATRTPFRSTQGDPVIHIKAGKPRTRRLEEGEEQRVLDAADSYTHDFFTGLLETGCRPGELRTLQWSEVRSDHFVVLAEKAKDREAREITITPTLQKILDQRKVGPDGQELGSDCYVFGNETGELVGRRRLCGLWLATCERAKVKNLHLHDLRREHATQLSEAGVPVDVIRDQLGHSNITMTNTYLGRSRDRLVQAAKQRTAMRARKAMRLARVGLSTRQAKSS